MNITRVEKLTHEGWLNLFAATFEHKGHEGRWVFASREETPHKGVVGRPSSSSRSCARPVRSRVWSASRIPRAGREYMIALPAGLVDRRADGGGDPPRAARGDRLRAGDVHRITQPLFSSAGLTDEAVSVAFVDVRGEPGAAQALEPGEDFEVMLLDYEGLCKLCDDTTQLVDAKAWMALFLYQQLGRIV